MENNQEEQIIPENSGIHIENNVIFNIEQINILQTLADTLKDTVQALDNTTHIVNDIVKLFKPISLSDITIKDIIISGTDTGIKMSSK